MSTVVELEFIPVSVPYVRSEVSSLVDRRGVTDILVRARDADGRVGWGESCSGANDKSVLEALRAMEPFVLGRTCWDTEAIRRELWKTAIWQYRKGTASFAFAGIDMALWDLCGKECGQPLYRLLGGQVRSSVNYFYYLERGQPEAMREQGLKGLAAGYTVFYLKVGIEIQQELEMVRALRDVIGPEAKIRLDANGAWRVNEAIRNIERFNQFDIDFVEQPVEADPVIGMQEVRRRTLVALASNEGMWSAEDAYLRITSRTADVYTFSPYWVGSLAEFQRLSLVANYEGLQVCRHSHGDLGIAAAAIHHACLTLPNLVNGNQQTAQILVDDVVSVPLPIASTPDWGVIEEPGLGIEVDENKVKHFHDIYKLHGQFLPYSSASKKAAATKHRGEVILP
jgi:L-alanine-DL-glutamate epimerase-like enolase superfamily enzyme